jgi:tellurite methyltransferase
VVNPLANRPSEQTNQSIHMNPESDNAGTTDLNIPPMRAQDFSEIEDWPGYFAAVLDKGARDTLVAALDSFDREGFDGGFAFDIAAGEGRDTLELLGRGWRVVATDGHPDAFNFLWPRVPEPLHSRLKTVEIDFCDMDVEPCDLVNASFALPFCEPLLFPVLWDRIVKAIRPGGRFAGQFFGKRDTWASMPNRTHHTLEEVRQLLEGFEIEMMREEERDDTPDVRNPKHWQLFHVVARKL